MERWLITGGVGFLGRAVQDRLREAYPADTVLAFGRRSAELRGDARAYPVTMTRSSWDLREPHTLSEIIREYRPGRVIHLAGRVPPSTMEELYDANTLLTVRLLEELTNFAPGSRVVLVGSAAELGPAPVEHLPLGEEYPCRPVGAYGMSKYLATTAGLSWRPGIEVVAARVFNPIGPGMPLHQAFGHFARSLLAARLKQTAAEAKAGRLQDPDCVALSGDAASVETAELVVGDLEAQRDFVDVRDVAAALVILALEGVAGRLYHVGSGRSTSARAGLEGLMALSGVTPNIRVDPSRINPQSPRDSRADISRILGETSWRPRYPFDQSVRDYWQWLLAETPAE